MKLGRLQIFLVAVTLCLLVVVLAPSSGLYKNAVSYLFRTNHPTLSYYLNRSDAGLAMQIGTYYFGAGAYDLDRAQKSFRRALAIEPDIQQAHYQLSRIYFVQANLTGALEEINAELTTNPLNQRSLYVRGLIELAQVNLPAAEADFRQFTLWAPTEWGGYNDLAFVLAKERKYAESEAVIEDALVKVPNGKDIPWLWNSLGLAQLNELHYTQAQASFGEALAQAQKLTTKDWRRAYSGNDPASDEESLELFRAAIEKNLETATRGNAL